MPIITINGTPINVPNTAQSPDWSEGIIQAFQAIEAALAAVIGTYDVPPQTFTIDAYNPGTDVDIPALSFPTDAVRAVFVRYMVYRATDSTEVDEQGELNALYNTDSGTWDFSRRYTGDAQITFSISNDGQVSFTTTSIAGSNHNGFITFTAQALENESN